ncbi:MAG: flagellar basal-body MS-ring/collar protein FliF [Geminicoccaceae bacterium]|nr:flagellar basal-body MS-ring/collar protein FliF [Geminicoccaceae bacterium]MDW8340485.1 flagellar basal-body MS-ring/collar protein FliF [Geminicoccaceae bacterium]
MAKELEAREPDASVDRSEGAAGPARLLAQIEALGPARILALGAVTVLLAAFFAYLVGRSLEQPYTLLFGGLAPEDARRIVERLETAGVPYRLAPTGDAVLVPADRALRLRMDLAQEGLPSGGTVGYELFDRLGPFGTSDFLANVNLRRALEGELARTIASLRPVRAARVHLVLPRREPFERERHPPSASVVVSLAGGASLDRRQIQGIRNLVAAAVPGLEAHRVTIVDDRGNLLARGGEPAPEGAFGLDLEEQRAALEQRLRAKILQILERSLGPGRVEAQVTVELDTEEVRTTTEQYDPNGQVARSTQTIEETGDRREAEGGTLTVTNNLPTERGAPGGTPRASERTSRSEETINYEISRTVRNQTRKPGQIKRLSIAVQVDHARVAAPDGSRRVEPRSAEELAQIAALVRSAAGVDEERGDRVEVVSRAFVEPEPEAPGSAGPFELTDDRWWRLGELAALALLAVLLLLFGVRPLVRSLARPTASVPAGPPVPTGGAGGPAAAAAAPPTVAGEEVAAAERILAAKENVPALAAPSLLDRVGGLVDEQPEDAVRVIRGWLQES